MKSFSEIITEAKIVEDGDKIIVTVPKGVGDEIQMSTFDVSDTDYGEMVGNKLHLYKKELKSLISRWKYDYHADYGLEDIKPAMKRKILELSKAISTYA